MTTPAKASPDKTAIVTARGWDLGFWFAILSPVLGVALGFLVLVLSGY